MRALVVEDSNIIRMILCQYLQKMNIQVVEAADGREALERLKEMSPPDLVLVDWNMPHLGVAMEAGANEYIQKPCTLDALREKLDMLGLLTK